MKKRFYRPWFLFMILSHLNLCMNGILNTAQDDWMTTNWPIWIRGFSQEFQRNGILLSCWHHTPFGMEESSQLFQRKGIACFTKHEEKNIHPGFVEDRGERREKKCLAGHQNMSVLSSINMQLLGPAVWQVKHVSSIHTQFRLMAIHSWDPH